MLEWERSTVLFCPLMDAADSRGRRGFLSQGTPVRRIKHLAVAKPAAHQSTTSPSSQNGEAVVRNNGPTA